jgi:hypothetical protein
MTFSQLYVTKMNRRSHEQIIAVFSFVLLKNNKNNVLLSDIGPDCLQKDHVPDLTEKFITA